jgi:XRE family transcriptional regulator, regulator of sulfur utilization
MESEDLSISDNLARLRAERKLTLESLAEVTGVSKSMLRQIETGRSSPTISVMWKIANGLKVSFSELLSTRAHTASVRNFDATDEVESGTQGYHLHPMVPFSPDRPVEMYYVEMDGGVHFFGEPHAQHARETVFLLAGQLTVVVSGESHQLAGNQVLAFDAGVSHEYVNVQRQKVRAIMMIDYATSNFPASEGSV